MCVCFIRVNLERLLDDKHFKDEIVHFNISEEGAVVQDDHRPQLIPLLMRCVCVLAYVHMDIQCENVKFGWIVCVCVCLGQKKIDYYCCCRILYGRMSTKGGSKFQGKTSTASRSSIVLRFLAGCQPQELGIFIDMLLEPVSHHSQGNTHTHTHKK